MPPVDSFWSLGMYGTDLNLVANPIDRYSIGDRTAGLRDHSALIVPLPVTFWLTCGGLPP